MDMKQFGLLILSALFSIPALAQALTGINFREQYNPESETEFSIMLVKGANQITMFFDLKTKLPLENYTISWEKRESFTQKTGTPLTELDSTKTKVAGNEKQGSFSFTIPTKSWLLVAKITNTANNVSWMYTKLIESKYPVTGWLEKQNERLNKKYISVNNEYTVKSAESPSLFVSYYKDNFAPASPPFTDIDRKADRFMFYDSTFKINSGDKFIPSKQGLYLFQQDTSAAEGFAYRCANDIYPKFSKISDLIAPMIFVTTQDEYNALLKTENDKAKFDKVILDITGDQERAKNFIRNYFRRVELANIYFSSFKEGWKTDRGMIYLIFGLPDEVSMNDGTEVWFYKGIRTSFTFVKSGSVYDPENYVLIRDKRFMETWFAKVDLIRKSRF